MSSITRNGPISPTPSTVNNASLPATPSNDDRVYSSAGQQNSILHDASALILSMISSNPTSIECRRGSPQRPNLTLNLNNLPPISGTLQLLSSSSSPTLGSAQLNNSPRKDFVADTGESNLNQFITELNRPITNEEISQLKPLGPRHERKKKYVLFPPLLAKKQGAVSPSAMPLSPPGYASADENFVPFQPKRKPSGSPSAIPLPPPPAGYASVDENFVPFQFKRKPLGSLNSASSSLPSQNLRRITSPVSQSSIQSDDSSLGELMSPSSLDSFSPKNW